MSVVVRAALTGASLLVLAACATVPAEPAVPAIRQSTAFTLRTDQPRTPEQLAVTFDTADLAFRVSPADRAIEGVATLDFTARSPIDRLVVELDTVFDVSAVSVDGVAVPAGQWTNPEGRMTIPLPRTLETGRSVSLRIAYSGHPRVAPRAPWNGGFVWSTTPDGQPWVASAIQLEGCDLFWPCIDNAQAEAGRVDLHITVPSTLSAPANGRFLGKQDHGDGWTTWNWTAAHPNTYAISLTVGPYEQLSADYHSRFGNVVPLNYWYLRTDDRAKAEALFAQFPRMLDFFEAKIGPYPFGDEKMGVVETPHLGMEHQTINAYGNEYKIDGRGYDHLLQHEFAHEWFANQLTNANADDMWLHEGLGSYMQPLYAGWLHGDRYMQAELADQRQGLVNAFPVVSGHPMGIDDVYGGPTGPGGDIYSKGSLVAHSLRMLIGDEAFFQSLTRLVYGRPDPRPGNFQPVFRSTPDFLAIVDQVTGGDYGWFFQAYLYQAALPVLHQTREGDRLSLEWTTEKGTPFPMPVEVEINGETRVVPMTDSRGEIAVSQGDVVRIDPRNKLLRQLDFIDAYNAAHQAERERVEAERRVKTGAADAR